MKKIIYCLFILILLAVPMRALAGTAAMAAPEPPKEPDNLYAQSAVLMDADSGRVLFAKNKDKKLPMASTTKIMTCIVALENGDTNDIVIVSKNASKMPDVQLNALEGEKFRLKDLLYSLMLESHNDSAYAIAEQIGGSAEGFAEMMNEKAKELGCNNTYFITPNGLDASDEKGTHSTTAAELARIMSYCIKESPKKDEFLEITRTASYSFHDISGKRSFNCNNHNAFLHMMEGALSGKTGFTGNAGYCYVGALEKDGKTFVVALLACGWPNNKSYKWSDTRKLMNYGLENYEYKNVWEDRKFNPVPVMNGIPESGDLKDTAFVNLGILQEQNDIELNLLLRKDEQVTIVCQVPQKLNAPMERGTVVGSVNYYLKEQIIKTYPVTVLENRYKIDYKWCFSKIVSMFLLN